MIIFIILKEEEYRWNYFQNLFQLIHDRNIVNQWESNQLKDLKWQMANLQQPYNKQTVHYSYR